MSLGVLIHSNIRSDISNPAFFRMFCIMCAISRILPSARSSSEIDVDTPTVHWESASTAYPSAATLSTNTSSGCSVNSPILMALPASTESATAVASAACSSPRISFTCRPYFGPRTGRLGRSLYAIRL